MGNPKSSIKTSIAVNYLNPTFVIMFGLAGGIPGEVKLTDVIISDEIFYVGQGKQRPNSREIRLESLQVDALLLHRLQDYRLQLGDKSEYSIHFGELAVGEDVIASDEGREAILDKSSKIIGIEMESYGVGLAVAYNDIGKLTRFIAIRGVSDFADPDKNDGYRSAALDNAADFLQGFLRSGLLPEPEKQREPTFIAINHYSITRRSSIQHAVDRYLDSLKPEDIIELVIDQTDIQTPEDGLISQNRVIKQLHQIQNSNPDCQLGYFGLAYIPFTFHLGCKIHRNTIDVFANDRVSAKWIELPKTSIYPEPRIEGPSENSSHDGDVIIRFSVSYEVSYDDIAGVVKDPIAEFHIHAESPKTDIIDSLEALDAYTIAFKDVLHRIETQYPNAMRIHVFSALPPTLAFRCGQQVNERIEAQTLVYHYDKQKSPKYEWAINLHTQNIIWS